MTKLLVILLLQSVQHGATLEYKRPLEHPRKSSHSMLSLGIIYKELPLTDSLRSLMQKPYMRSLRQWLFQKCYNRGQMRRMSYFTSFCLYHVRYTFAITMIAMSSSWYYILNWLVFVLFCVVYFFGMALAVLETQRADMPGMPKTLVVYEVRQLPSLLFGLPSLLLSLPWVLAFALDICLCVWANSSRDSRRLASNEDRLGLQATGFTVSHWSHWLCYGKKSTGSETWHTDPSK